MVGTGVELLRYTMLRIQTKVWSHATSSGSEKMFVSEVTATPAKEINTFRELVQEVAEIAYRNSEHVLFFRGQQGDYKKRANNQSISSIYPSIYRHPGKTLSNAELENRFAKLDKMSFCLLQKLKSHEIDGVDRLSKFPELLWAILQHYEVCDTPLLDVTHSLRVAASFALNGNETDGYLYVLGFPHTNGSITYSVDAELINIRLLSICPPKASRPYFQEGFLVGSFPMRRLRKHPNLDAGRRVIAKFRLVNNKFWDNHFHAIPTDALFPDNDLIKTICEDIKLGIKEP